jgi:predicted metalloprotease with PDZ domain
VRVTITLSDPKAEESFAIPAWCPGFYFIQHYEDKISDFKAVDPSGNPLKVAHSSSSRQWTVADPNGDPMTVSYRVLGDDPGLGFFGTSVLSHTAFVNGPSAFMYAAGRLQEPTKLNVKVPPGWKIATPMDPASEGQYRASGYDELIDHPIQMGQFETRHFIQGGIPFEVVFVSRDQQYRCNLDEETERLKVLSLPALKLFGNAQFKRYTYFIHLAVGNFNGGLEHRASNVQAIQNGRPLNIDDLAAHEYFHAWNVKQIRPKLLGPFDYSKEQRTGNLWFAEGVTDYYAKITTYRSGLQDQTWLFRELGNQIAELQRGNTRKQYSVAEASRQCWEFGGFGVKDLSYYVKGLLIGWIFDAVIRDATDGDKSLDDVMKLMYKRHQLPAPGYEESGVLAAINEVSGSDFTALYNRMVNTTDELPYELLGKLALTVDSRSGRVLLDESAPQKAMGLRKAWLNR